MIRTLTEVSPVVIAVDDLPWLDRPSARVLDFIVRRASDLPVGFLPAIRTTGESPDGPEIEFAGPVERLEIGPLDIDAIDALLRRDLDLASLDPTWPGCTARVAVTRSSRSNWPGRSAETALARAWTCCPSRPTARPRSVATGRAAGSRPAPAGRRRCVVAAHDAVHPSRVPWSGSCARRRRGCPRAGDRRVPAALRASAAGERRLRSPGRGGATPAPRSSRGEHRRSRGTRKAPGPRNVRSGRDRGNPARHGGRLRPRPRCTRGGRRPRTPRKPAHTIVRCG